MNNLHNFAAQSKSTSEATAAPAGAPPAPPVPPAGPPQSAEPGPVARAWYDRSRDLAIWVEDRHGISRRDVWGGYTEPERRGQPYTRADGTTGIVPVSLTMPATHLRGRHTLDLGHLVAHFRGRRKSHVVGLHTTSPRNTCCWGATESDVHSDAGDDVATPEAILAANTAWYRRLLDSGITPLLTGSNGRGGVHLRVLLSEPVSSELMFYFLHWLVRDHTYFGLPTTPEVFPKQARLNSSRPFGNWLRLPGPHHTRDYYSEVWDGERWLEGHAAIDHILATEPGHPDRLWHAMHIEPGDVASLAAIGEGLVYDARRNRRSASVRVFDRPTRVPAGEVGARCVVGATACPGTDGDALVRLATLWLEQGERPISIQGQYGSDPLMSVVRGLHTGLGLSRRQIRVAIVPWNGRCLPPWSDTEIEHALDTVESTPDPAGRDNGFLLDAVTRLAGAEPDANDIVIPGDMPEDCHDAYREFLLERRQLQARRDEYYGVRAGRIGRQAARRERERDEARERYDRRPGVVRERLAWAHRTSLNEARYRARYGPVCDARLVPCPTKEQVSLNVCARIIKQWCDELADRVWAERGPRAANCGVQSKNFEDVTCPGNGRVGRHYCNSGNCPHCVAYIKARAIRHVAEVLLYDSPPPPDATKDLERMAATEPVYAARVTNERWKATHRQIARGCGGRATYARKKLFDGTGYYVVSPVPFSPTRGVQAEELSRAEGAQRLAGLIPDAVVGRGWLRFGGCWVPFRPAQRYRVTGQVADEDAARRVVEAAGASTYDLLPDGTFAGGFGYRGLSVEAQILLRPWIEDGAMPSDDVLAMCRGERPMPVEVLIEAREALGQETTVRLRVRAREPAA
jgi:hypothetical protein